MFPSSLPSPYWLLQEKVQESVEKVSVYLLSWVLSCSSTWSSGVMPAVTLRSVVASCLTEAQGFWCVLWQQNQHFELLIQPLSPTAPLVPRAVCTLRDAAAYPPCTLRDAALIH